MVPIHLGIFAPTRPLVGAGTPNASWGMGGREAAYRTIQKGSVPANTCFQVACPNMVMGEGVSSLKTQAIENRLCRWIS